jgi:hypothetical protein
MGVRAAEKWFKIKPVSWSHFACGAVSMVAIVAVALPGCSGGDDPAPFNYGTGTNKDGGTGPGGDGICLLNNCSSDAECADCSSGRTSCSQQSHRCIACGPEAGGKTCPSGQYCTAFGECVPNGVTCPVDGNGIPTITCKNNADCGACGPRNRICDAGSNKCVGCLPTDTTFCQSTDFCAPDNSCKAKCPSTCNADADCGQCGAPGKEAHACNRHVCAQCSPTKGCDGGLSCDTAGKGTCSPSCGVPGRKDACTADGNCAGCTATTQCDLPVNGGDGTCSVPATGCSDLGKFAVLPPPFANYTNLCSNDSDCRAVDIDYNAGKALRDATGLSFIKDANISYPMHACASVKVLGKSCGMCVPCKTDAECTPIDVKQFAGSAFGPLGAAATSVLLDKAFGPNDKKIHMYCQNVAGDYGVCVPCANFLSSCSDGGDIPPGAQCTHDECTTGDRLDPTCTACTGAVCAKDAYCCASSWDDLCKREVEDYCTTKTCKPDSCAYRPAGWYCFDDASKGGYRCQDGTQNIAEGRQCPSTQYCHKTGTGVKDPAVLCKADTDPGCGTGTTGKPECFATP